MEAEETKAGSDDNPSADIVEQAVEGAAPAEATANRDLQAIAEETVEEAGDAEAEKDTND